MSDKNDVAISVKDVSKTFRLPHERQSTIKSMFTNIFKGKGSKYYEPQHALKDISFEVKKGEFFGIVGRNGSGKSTLLKILAEIYQPTGGSVETRGKLVPFIELGVGFNPELTGRENVYLNGAMLGFSKEEVAQRYDKIVEFAELEQHMDQKLKNYSSGMQVRLAFSVAIQADADILLIDEVLAVGDADFQRKCYNFFSSLKSLNTTVIFVTHDMEAVREYCDVVMLIENGLIQASGSADSVAQEYTKLFNIQDDEQSAYRNTERWGNNHARYTNLQVDVKPDFISVNLAVECRRTTEALVFGVRVRSVSGTDVLGSNTVLSGEHSHTLTKGDTATVNWMIPNILSEGEYYIEPAIVVGDGATVCDWWNHATRVDIRKGEKSGYLVSPGVEYSFHKGDG